MNQQTNRTNRTNRIVKEYTPYRRFLAWVGFVTLLTVFPAIVTALVWANGFIDRDLHDNRTALIEKCTTKGGEPIYDSSYPNLIECDYDK